MLVATSRWILAYVTQSLAGFFHTGDLAMRDDQGRYHVLGRVASTHAVAGGNVVVPDQVENVYQASPFVRQVFIHTSVQHAQPVAVVVVDTAYVAGWFSRDGYGCLTALLSYTCTPR